MSAKFITFEGGEGAGKSVQITRFMEYLQAQNKKVVLTREPGGTDVGKQIRKLLVEGDKDKFDEITEILLFYADRRINITQVIQPALRAGKYVISDRYNDSTIAYQFYGSNKFKTTRIMDSLYEIVADPLKPDVTFLLDIDVKVGLERSFKKSQSMDTKELRFENVDIDFHERLRQGYLELAKQNPDRFIIINANQSIEDVTKEIISKYEAFINKD